MTINWAVGGVVFKVYVEEVWSPILKVGDVVVMDNLPAHKVAGIKELIEACGAKVIYLRLYSPDLNPIEKCWSKIKTYLRKALRENARRIRKSLARGFITDYRRRRARLVQKRRLCHTLITNLL